MNDLKECHGKARSEVVIRLEFRGIATPAGTASGSRVGDPLYSAVARRL